MKTNKLKKLLAVTATAALLTSLAACGSSSTASTAEAPKAEETKVEEAAEEPAEEVAEEATEEVAEEAAETEVTVIKAATGGGPKPYVYVGEDDLPTGYDIEVLKAVFDVLPEYELEIEVTDFGSVFAGLTAGNYQVGVNNFSYNEERAQNYLYSVPYDKVSYVFVYKNGNDPVTSFDDVAGKAFEGGAGVSVTNAVEKWNEANPDKAIVINYTDADTAVGLQHIEDGAIDFGIIDGPMYTAYVNEYGFDLAKYEIPDEETSLIADNLYAYFILPKDQTALRDRIDEALVILKENGTLKKLSEEYFGGVDQSPEEEALQAPLN